jgi:hypothetical protein
MENAIKCEKCGREFTNPIQIGGSPFMATFGNSAVCPHCHASTRLPSTERIANFKFSRLSNPSQEAYSNNPPTTAALVDVHKSFIQNMDRVFALGDTPFLLLFQFRFYADYLRFSNRDWGVTVNADPPAGVAPGMHVIANPEDVDDWLARVSNDATFFALEGMLSSMLIGTWTAFEVLAGDLWEAAMNCHPQTLAALEGDPVGWQNGNSSQDREDEQRGGAKGGEKSIALGLLQPHFRDPSVGMGTILRSRYTFQTLPVIRKAYCQAFSIDFDIVRDALIDTSLDHLAGTRNALVHRAGKADNKFKAQTKDCIHFSGIKPGDHIKVDGEIVSDIVGNAVKQAVKLIVSVDRWICDH